MYPLSKYHENRLKRIIDETHDKLFSVLFAMCGEVHLSEDIMQECYIRLWQHIHEVKDDHAILALLRQYARNIFLDEMRKRGRQKALLLNVTREDLSPPADEKIIGEEKHQLIQRAINKLPQQQQLIFRMHKEHDMSYRQIAAELEIATGTIEKQMNRALRSLKHELHHLKRVDAGIIVYIAMLQLPG